MQIIRINNREVDLDKLNPKLKRVVRERGFMFYHDAYNESPHKDHVDHREYGDYGDRYDAHVDICPELRRLPKHTDYSE